MRIIKFLSPFIVLLLCLGSAFGQKEQTTDFNQKLAAQSSVYQENKGQVVDTKGEARPEILFTSFSNGVRTYYKANGISYVFEKHNGTSKEPSSKSLGKKKEPLQKVDGVKKQEVATIESTTNAHTIEMHRIDLNLIGSNPSPTIVKEKPNAVVDNFYLGHANVSNVHSYGKVIYKDIYKNIDMVLYTVNGKLKYDFIVYPGGNPDDIKFKIDGTEKKSLSAEGELILGSHLGSITEGKPYSLQTGREVASSYVLNGDILSFNIPSYNKAETLTIDPTREWGTFYTASNGYSEWSFGQEVCALGSGVLYAVNTSANNYPSSVGVFDPSFNGGFDIQIGKFDSAGNLIWNTYIGSSNNDIAPAMAAFSNTFVLSGITEGSDFPTTAGTHDQLANGSWDYFLTQFNATTGTLDWSTLIGGSNQEFQGNAVDINSSGEIVFAGNTNSTDLPMVASYDNSFNGNKDVFLAKFNNTGNIIWSTYFGGSGFDDIHRHDLEFLPNGTIALLGRTTSGDIPITSGVFDQTFSGGYDLFLSNISANGTTLNYSTYIGNSGQNGISCSGCDSGDQTWYSLAGCSDNSVVVGAVDWAGVSTAWAYTAGAYSSAFGGSNDSYVIKFDNTGNRIWGTTWGGNSADWLLDVAVDNSDNVFLYTGTISSDLPVTADAHQLNATGSWDKHLAQLSANGSTLIYGSYLGSDQYDMPEVGTISFESGAVYAGATSDFTGGNPAWMTSVGAYQTNATGTNSLYPVLNKFLFCDVVSSSNVTNESCAGTTDGAIDVTSSTTSEGVLSYLWSNGATTEDLSGLSAGNYTLTITGSVTGCSVDLPFTVFAPVISSSSINASDVLCADGTVPTVNKSVASIEFKWLETCGGGATVDFVINGQTAFTGASPNNCTCTPGVNSSGSITNPAILAYIVDGSNTFIHNLPSNQLLAWSKIIITFSDATTQEIVIYDLGGGGDATSENPDLCVSNYTNVSTASVSDNVQLINITPVPYPGNIDLTVVGGLSSGYTYLWSNGATTQDIQVTAPGTYSVDISYPGCGIIGTQSVVISGPSLNGVATNGTCGVFTAAGVDLTPTGFTAPIVYSWSNGATSEDIIGLTSATYTVTVTDGSNCPAYNESFTILNDAVPPIALCQDITVTLVAGNATITGADVDNGSYDACNNVALSVSPNTFTTSDVGPNPVVLTVTDDDGNTATCNAIVTITANNPPTMVCQNVTAYAGASCTASAVASDFDNGSFDSDGNPFTLTVSPSGPYPLGTTNVVLTGDDGLSTASCNATITVLDTISPTAICQNYTLVLDANGQGTITSGNINNSSTDNCSVASITATPNTFTCAEVGPNNVTLTVTDGSGNVSTCVAVVTVVDNTAPVISCQDITVPLDATGNASILPSDVLSSAAYVVSQAGTFSPLPVGGTQLFLSDDVTTGSLPVGFNFSFFGNTYSQFTLSSNGFISFDPAVSQGCCQGAILPSNDAVNNVIAWDWNDLYPPSGGSIFYETIGTAPNRSLVVSYTNQSHCCGASLDNTGQIILRETSNIIEMHTTQVTDDGSVHTMGIENANGTEAFTVAGRNSTNWTVNNDYVAFIPAGIATDSCGIASTTVSPNTFTCSNVGPNSVTVTVTDVNGNVSTCNSTVTIVDTISPIASCQNINAYLDATGNVTIAATDVDNGSTDVCGIASLTLDNTAFSCANVGPNTVTLTATDVNGNSSTCSSTVTVIDTISPSIVCTPTISVNSDPTTCGAIVSFVAPTATDNCTSGGGGTMIFTNAGATGRFGPTQAECNAAYGPGVVTVTTQGVQQWTVPTTGAYTIQVAGAQGGDKLDYLNNGGLGQIITSSINLTAGQVINVVVGQQGGQNLSPNSSGGGGGGGGSFVYDNATNTLYLAAGGGGGIGAGNSTRKLGRDASIGRSSGVNQQDNDNGPSSYSFNAADGQGGASYGSLFSGDYDSGGGAGWLSDGANGTQFAVTEGGKTRVNNWVGGDFSATRNPYVAVGGFGGGGGTSDGGGGGGGYTGGNGGRWNGLATGGGGGTSYDINSASPASLGLNPGNGSVTITLLASSTAVTQTDITGLTSGDLFPVGTTTLEYTATDGSGNTSVCTFDVTVTDNVPPVALCQNINAYLDATGNVMITAAQVDNGSTDNCAVASLAIDIANFSCANVGPNTVVLTVTDVNGNSSTCTSTVTVIDTISPIASCQNIYAYLDATGNVTIAASDVDNGSTDNCTIASLAIDVSNFSCANVGPNTVVLTVTDVNGNSSTCTSTVTVIDTISPIASCQNINAYLDATGNVMITAAQVDNGSTDNCAVASLAIDIANFSCANVGPNTVVLTVTDVNGNSSTCTSTVTVIDTISPIASCQNINAYLDATGNVTIVASDVDNGSTDNCAVATLAIDIANFSCANVGPNTVVLTVTDVNGNSSTCTSTVTVIDTIAPVASCQNINAYLDGSGNVTIAASDVDNGSTDNCAVASIALDITSFVCADLGANTVTLTVTDVNGNSSTCTSTVTVLDTINPTFTSTQANITVNNVMGVCGKVVTYPMPTFSDNCTSTISQTDGTGLTSGDLFPVGTTTQTYTVTDAGGNTAVITFTITVVDNEVPVISNCPSNIIVSSSAAACGNNVNWTMPTVSDNCPGTLMTSSHTPGTFFPVGTTTVTYNATDNSGNTAICTFTVTVNDDVAPVVPVLTTVNGECSASATAPTTTDNCSGVITGTTTDLLTYATQGTFTITWSFVDGAGNTSTATQTVIVDDVTAPVVPVLATVTGECSATATAPTTTDNCAGTITGTTTDPLTYAAQGTYTITWSFNDGNGNTSTATQTVVVNDVTPPVASCQNFTVNLSASGNATITAANIDNGSTDNCGIASLSVSPSAFDCSNVGPNTVTLTVTDINGNTSTCTSTVTVVDVTPLTWVTTTPNITVNAIPGFCGRTVNYVAPTFSDNCAATMTQTDGTGYTSGDVFPVGTTTLTYTATNGAGEVITHSFTVTVVDAQAPTISSCPANITVNTSAATCGTNVTWSAPTASDNCTGVVLTTTNAPGSFFPVGTTTVTYTATDNAGNTTLCTFNVTVIDNVAPVAPTLATVTGQCSASVTAPTVTDACSGPIVGTTTDPLTYSVQGTYTVTWTFTDGNGNTSTATQTVVVDDTTPPIVPVLATATGECSASVTAPTTTDNCSGTITGTTTDPLTYSTQGTFTVTWSFNDGNGNISTATQTVIVDDVTAPIVPILANVNGECSATATAPTTTDNCAGTITGTTTDPVTYTTQGTHVITWTFDDGNGNTSTTTQNVVINDVTAPTISAAADTTVDANNFGCSALDVVLTAPVTADNCSVVSVTNDAPNPLPFGNTVVTWTVTDINGNTSTDQQTVTVTSNITSSITVSSCDDYTAPDGTVYTTSGTYTATILSYLGCDSVITVNLTILNSTSSSITIDACKTYTAPDGQVLSNSGTYTATITNAAGCDSIITVNLTIHNLDLTVGTQQNGTEFIAFETGVTYQWYNCTLDSIVVGATSQTYVPVLTSEYAVILSDGVCTDTSDCYKISLDVVIPEVFSPNGDGLNDVFEIVGIEDYPQNHLTVFNRWGQVVFEADGYKNDWDGTNQSDGAIATNQLPVGTYFYVIDLGPSDDIYVGQVYKGYVFLTR